ncbi:hypothetical protein GCM10010392_02070 [Streptomyces clavifer]|nr:hypothetical protein GCM10010392_02070 [Streptomyces clavifer]
MEQVGLERQAVGLHVTAGDGDEHAPDVQARRDGEHVRHDDGDEQHDDRLGEAPGGAQPVRPLPLGARVPAISPPADVRRSAAQVVQRPSADVAGLLRHVVHSMKWNPPGFVRNALAARPSPGHAASGT